MAAATPLPRHAPTGEPRFYDVTSRDGTVLRAWTNDVDGPTVLLCNGLGTNPWTWPTLLDPACGVRVVSWNHRGVGGSERPADPERVDIEDFADDAVAVMDHAGIDACVLMGWSMGVNTMFEVAVTHPERVTGLFAVGGVPGDTFASMLAPLGVPRAVRKPITVGVARGMKWLGRPISAFTQSLAVSRTTYAVLTHSGFMHPTPDPVNTRRAVREFLTTPIDWYMHLALHSSLHRRVSLRGIEVPTSFLAGTHDVLASAHDMRTAAERIPGAAYRRLRATHFLGMEHPEVVHEALLELLARVPESPSATVLQHPTAEQPAE